MANGKNYNEGKIYQLKCLTTGEYYVGSTTKKYLSQRLVHHKAHYKQWKEKGTRRYLTSFRIIERGNYEMLLLEAYPCNSCDELHARERYWIEKMEQCVNQYIPTRTVNERRTLKRDEYNAYHREYNNSKRIQCGCGSEVNPNNIARHKRSQKHRTWVEQHGSVLG